MKFPVHMLLETLARQKLQRMNWAHLWLEFVLPSVGAVFVNKHTFSELPLSKYSSFSYQCCQLIQTGHKPVFLEVG